MPHAASARCARRCARAQRQYEACAIASAMREPTAQGRVPRDARPRAAQPARRRSATRCSIMRAAAATPSRRAQRDDHRAAGRAPGAAGRRPARRLARHARQDRARARSALDLRDAGRALRSQALGADVAARRHDARADACPTSRCASTATRCASSRSSSNLLTNALKYTPAGGHIERRASARRGRQRRRSRVRDNGIGIDAEMLPRVFELFAQARRSLDRVAGRPRARPDAGAQPGRAARRQGRRRAATGRPAAASSSCACRSRRRRAAVAASARRARAVAHARRCASWSSRTTTTPREMLRRCCSSARPQRRRSPPTARAARHRALADAARRRARRHRPARARRLRGRAARARARSATQRRCSSRMTGYGQPEDRRARRSRPASTRTWSSRSNPPALHKRLAEAGARAPRARGSAAPG